MPILLALAVAAAALPPPPPEQAADIRCVALLAIVANEQTRGTGWTSTPPLADDGARYSDVVGTELMKATGRTKEQVRALFVAAVAGFQSAAVRGHDHAPG
ncbi:MAG: hypothetical protein H0X36_03445, partial [Sphingomonadaceae bacterium]|nr:hypothetical protein [Sphingomonadaceae bacterium]